TGNQGSLRCDRKSLAYFALGGVFENSGVFLVLAALGFGDVSIVTPLAGTAPLFVLLLAYLFPSHAEKIGWRVVTGAVLIVAGVVLLSRWAAIGGPPPSPPPAPSRTSPRLAARP